MALTCRSLCFLTSVELSFDRANDSHEQSRDGSRHLIWFKMLASMEVVVLAFSGGVKPTHLSKPFRVEVIGIRRGTVGAYKQADGKCGSGGHRKAVGILSYLERLVAFMPKIHGYDCIFEAIGRVDLKGFPIRHPRYNPIHLLPFEFLQHLM